MTLKILFVAANADPDTPLAVDDEFRRIVVMIRASDARDQLQLLPCLAARPGDLQQGLLEHRPHVVHFSGHGNDRQLLLCDDQGKPKLVSAEALRDLFESIEHQVRLVVLNACSTSKLASALVEQVDCAVGMRLPIGDKAAVTFAAALYRALGFPGRSVQEAFALGRNMLLLEGIPEEKTPELFARPGLKPNEVILVEPSMG